MLIPSIIESTTIRILLLGKSGNGKSSLANTIFGETAFKVKNFNDLKTFVSEAKIKCINGRSITLIDTPGFFDQGRSEDEVKPELMRCITECAPGPHVFLIVFKVERYTEQEQAVTNEILQYFSDDALKYAVVVFTHGDQLPEGMKIEQYVSQSEGLRGLVKKCGDRCHVFDCKYWKNTEQEDNYRSNQFQVAELLVTIDKMLMKNTGEFYTNAVLSEVEREIQEEAQRIRLSSKTTSEEEIRELAKINILKKQMKGATLWIKGSVVAVTGLFAAVSAWVISSRVGQTSTVVALPNQEILDQGFREIAESVVKAEEAIVPLIVKAGEEVGQTTVSVTDVAETGAWVIFEALTALYERTYDPYNLFV
ncbi:GTPase IMAP family member 7-like isoform X1 [Kryptolebias marmoratus]|uniref:GTPase IMAP family member 7-like isoform X1 n=1 Tax=Kryptolebias marmoratus TaxID=37003 RepID=UPI000D530F81|nr:GTPase IMAP family member 7-like isoform X1 [Kryptolebias marmoratus]